MHLSICVWALIERAKHAFTPQPIATRANIGEGHAEESPSASPLPSHPATVTDDNPEAGEKSPLSDASDDSPAASPVPAADEQVTTDALIASARAFICSRFLSLVYVAFLFFSFSRLAFVLMLIEFRKRHLRCRRCQRRQLLPKLSNRMRQLVRVPIR